LPVGRQANVKVVYSELVEENQVKFELIAMWEIVNDVRKESPVGVY